MMGKTYSYPPWEDDPDKKPVKKVTKRKKVKKLTRKQLQEDLDEGYPPNNSYYGGESE